MTEHDKLISQLKKPGDDILKDLTPTAADLLHLCLGLCGEAGEVADAIKKFAIYNKPIDMENVVEELGDIEFYLGAIRQTIGVNRSAILAHNTKKLRKRYGTSYSNSAAQARADKVNMDAGMGLEPEEDPIEVSDSDLRFHDLCCALCGESGHGSGQCTTPGMFRPNRGKEVVNDG